MTEGKSLKACVLGSNVERSLSPSLHTYWLEKYGINGKYSAKNIDPSKLAEVFDELENEGYSGCNLTYPLKEAARNLMDEVCGSCEATNATNTVIFKDGRRIGFNTDWYGFISGLNEKAPGWKKGRTVILGGGNAARSALYALMLEGVKDFVVTNRTSNKIGKIGEDLGLNNVKVYDWSERDHALEGADLLINSTSLGMKGNPDLNLNLDYLPKEAIVCDLVYRPYTTSLLTQAEKRGNKTVEGLPMLVHQGKLGFRKWFGIEPEVDEDLYSKMRAEL